MSCLNEPQYCPYCRGPITVDVEVEDITSNSPESGYNYAVHGSLLPARQLSEEQNQTIIKNLVRWASHAGGVFLLRDLLLEAVDAALEKAMDEAVNKVMADREKT